MEKKKTLLLLILVFVLLLGGAYVLYNRLGSDLAPDQLMIPTKNTQPSSGSVPTEENSNPAPNFTVYDLNGTPVQLSDYLGKPTVLNFWASWCGPCQMEMPDFQEKYQELGQEVNFLMVNVGDNSLEATKKYAADNGFTFPVYFDYTEEAMYTYGATSIPKTFFFDANGNAVYYAPGMIDGVTLENTIIDVMNR